MSAWYPIAAMCRLKKLVRVRWGWLAPFEAVLVEAKPRVWASLAINKKTGATEVAWLPPDRVKGGFQRFHTVGEMVPMTQDQLDRWGPEPTAWQPIGEWPDPLPEPLPISDTIIPRDGSIGKVAFNATEAAAEMEADREAARNRSDEPETVSLGWWHDASRVKYQPVGAVDREMAEARVMRALACCGAGEQAAANGLAMSRFLAEMAAMTLSEALAAQEKLASTIVRLRQLRADREDFLTALGWYCRLGEGNRQNVLFARSLPLPMAWTDIGRKLGRFSATRARQIYDSAIDRIHAIANQPEVVDVAILKLQRENRAYHRRAG